MQYDHLIARIAKLSGYPESIVRDILWALPDALLHLPEGETVRTPLGRFRMVRKAGRAIKLPGSEKKAQMVERLQVRLEPNKRLKKAIT
jgi:nucleoid DNA-binding protein